jgi:predicted NBD/HSP70 family sugar kinase
MMKKIDSSVIKKNNRNTIYRFIKDRGFVSKQDIVVGLGLSLPTVTQNLQYLEHNGLIDGSTKISNTGGRNATAYSCVKEAKIALGVYLTAKQISVVAVDLQGNILTILREKVTFNLDDDNYLKKLGKMVVSVKESVLSSDDELLGVGLAVPGLVSEDGERVRYGYTLDFTGKTKIEIAKYIPYETKMFHDSIVAGYAEVWVAKEVQNAFHISLNYSVGGVVITNRKIHAGNSEKSGEIGHMTTVPVGGKRCYCGQYGCYDTVGHAGNLDVHTNGNLEMFFKLYAEGDPKVKEVWDEYLDNLAIAINNIRVLFDCDIILGGYVGTYIEEYMDDIQKRVNRRNPFSETDDAADYLLPCKYKREATAAGAAIVLVSEFLDNI